mmetsp:Transcript_23019/g.50517  ORF Transcript_23019/g.50517 Transcript_23019/m.50517 type:complete len:629 (+) Transcript_23019:144-2030(+)|eukprot:CAMPEP_0202896834 /NCGR_PEP_ID=MMETSP1392-20130828/5746_1 /ASSEMBLY_ACC=CAM_ASM_000868 /TAXON_ID=225041 /ORGANISM="Chlamydomonas chlamydogama, Strain SAG 11-48b" /LENGTH=628 /DNA_ID=CAMNT_0049582317 /DNA_START=132 /DNA_END=2018 /DNA_ORIENTATION=-
MGDFLLEAPVATRSGGSVMSVDMTLWKSITNQYHRGRAQRVYLGELTQAEKEELQDTWNSIMDESESKEMTYMHLIKVADTVLGKDSYSLQDLKKAMIRVDLSKNGCIDFHTFKAYMASTMSASVDAESTINTLVSNQRGTEDEMILVGSMRLNEMIRIYRRRIMMERLMRDQSSSGAVKRGPAHKLQNHSVCRALSSPVLDVPGAPGPASSTGPPGPPTTPKHSVPRKQPSSASIGSVQKEDAPRQQVAEPRSSAGSRVLRFMKSLFKRSGKVGEEKGPALARQPSIIARQPSMTARQPSMTTGQPSIIAQQPPSISARQASVTAWHHPQAHRVSIGSRRSSIDVPMLSQRSSTTALVMTDAGGDASPTATDAVLPFAQEEAPAMSLSAAGAAVMPHSSSQEGLAGGEAAAATVQAAAPVPGTAGGPARLRARVKRNSTEPLLMRAGAPHHLTRDLTTSYDSFRYSASASQTAVQGSAADSVPSPTGAARRASQRLWPQPPQQPQSWARAESGCEADSVIPGQVEGREQQEGRRLSLALEAPGSPRLYSSGLSSPVISGVNAVMGEPMLSSTGRQGSDALDLGSPVHREGPSNFSVSRGAAPMKPGRKLVVRRASAFSLDATRGMRG